ncbi:MAG: BON domain-containing protein [Sediminibacterium sp.]
MKKIISSVLLVSALFFASCAQKDEDINKNVTTDVQAVTPGVSTDVKEGVVTLSGQVKDETERAAAEDAAKKVSGVKTVVNNIIVTLPSPPEPVVNLSGDDVLQNAVNDLIKEYSDVTGKVTDGEIVINGEITKAGWAKLKPALEALKPRRLNSEILHIK